MPIEAF